MGWLARVLKGIRDRIAWVFSGVFGPPLEALKRLIAGLRERTDGAISKLLEWWANIWSEAPKDEKESLGEPTKAAPLVAAAVMGAVCYSWSAPELVGSLGTALAAVVVWFVALRLARRWSYPDSPSRARRMLREAERRAGLLWWERLGAVLALVLIVLSFGAPHVLPLAIALGFGFLRLLITEYKLRELKRMREAPLTPPPPPDEDDPDYVTRTFHWNLRIADSGDEHSMSVPVHVPTYERLKRDNPVRQWDGETPRFDRWIIDGSTPEVDRSAVELQTIADARSYSTFREVSNALAFVQSIEYSLDEDTTGHDDYWRYPVETIFDETGDCEDTTILAGAVLRRLGHRVAVFLLPEHAALGVEVPPGTPGEFLEIDGRRMYYCETTGEGWKVGELPSSYRGVKVKTFTVDP